MTAPEFRPYERRYANKRTLPKPVFLSNEDEQDIDPVSDSVGVACDLGDSSDSEEPPAVVRRTEEKAIYIDEVLDRALR